MVMAVQSLYETDEAQQLRDSARGFLARYRPPDKAFEDASKPDELWQRIAAQGWTSLGSDAEAGGLGEALILLEELGRAACPMPLLDTFLATTVLRGIDTTAVHEVLGALEAGTAAISVALGPLDGDRNAGSIPTVKAADGTMNFSGTVRFVEGLSFTTYVLVAIGSKETADEMALLRVDASGVTVTPTPGFAMP